MVHTFEFRVLPLTLVALSVAMPGVARSDMPAGFAAELAVASPSREWRTIVLHHSATLEGNVASIDAVHRQQKDSDGNPWLGIGYHFVVGNGRQMGDGEVRATFRWRGQMAGAHAGRSEQNEHGIGICLIGNFEDTPPTPKQLAALTELLKTLSMRYAITRSHVLRHQDVRATLCPGRFFPWEQMLAEVPEVYVPKEQKS
jgi:hypothetical protein